MRCVFVAALFLSACSYTLHAGRVLGHGSCPSGFVYHLYEIRERPGMFFCLESPDCPSPGSESCVDLATCADLSSDDKREVSLQAHRSFSRGGAEWDARSFPFCQQDQR